jgi:hypothetical protein
VVSHAWWLYERIVVLAAAPGRVHAGAALPVGHESFIHARFTVAY